MHSAVRAVHQVRLLSVKYQPWAARSPDALFIVATVTFDDEFRIQSFLMGTVHIKTAAEDGTVGTKTANVSPDIICRFPGDADLYRYIPEAHVGQVIPQMVTIYVDIGGYVAASELQVMFIVSLFKDEFVCEASHRILKQFATVVEWAHVSAGYVQIFAEQEDSELLGSRYPF